MTGRRGPSRLGEGEAAVGAGLMGDAVADGWRDPAWGVAKDFTGPGRGEVTQGRAVSGESKGRGEEGGSRVRRDGRVVASGGSEGGWDGGHNRRTRGREW